MARYKSLRSRATKDSLEDLRLRAMYAYTNGVISRRRMDLLLGLCDAYEREALLPQSLTKAEAQQEAAMLGGALTKQARRAMLSVLAGKRRVRR